MVSPRRQAALSQAKADRDFDRSEYQLELNTKLPQPIASLTAEIHAKVVDKPQS